MFDFPDSIRNSETQKVRFEISCSKLCSSIFFLFPGLIYCVGGCSTNTRRLQDLSSYDPETSKWTPLAEMSVPRSQMGVAILDDFLYVVGGMSINQDVLESVERYSFKEVRKL